MKVEVELLSPFYQELYEEMDEKVMLDFYELYRGLTINVPQKLYDSKKVKNYLKKKYENEDISKELIRTIVNKFDYSERHVYRILKK